MSKKIKILALRTGCSPVVEEITPSLEAMQIFVGGYVQFLNICEDLYLVCDEEGKLKNKPLNRSIFNGQDIVVGDAFIMKLNSDGDEVSLTDSDIEQYISQQDVMIR